MLTTRELTERIVHRHESDQAWRDAYQAIRNLGTLMFRRHRNQARYTRNVR